MFKVITLRLRLKSCPRCRGDLALELDHWGWYEQCIQCGYLHDLPDADGAKQQPVQRRKKEVARSV
jgi:hypothetical protein